MTYEQSLEYLSGLAPRGWRLGLDRMQEFARRAGLAGSLGEGPSPKFIHVAGTNGKGSTTAFLQSMLDTTGANHGSFFSPYVVDPRERIQHRRELISEADFASIVSDLQPVAEEMEGTEFAGVTEFEFKTAVGFEYWKRKRCEWVALEVGLGGRLDATNIVTPAVSVIVSIGLDHVNILGGTHQKIAHEKAGILKPGVPAVIGRVNREAAEEIERCAQHVGADLWWMDREIRIADIPGGVKVETPLGSAQLFPSLTAIIQRHNAALAFAALLRAGFGPGIAPGAAEASIPGRLQTIHANGIDYLLDGAHNTESAAALAESLGDRKAYHCVTGMLEGHQPEAFYGALKGKIAHAYVTRIDFHRTQDPVRLAATLNQLGIPASAHETSEAAIQAASEAVRAAKSDAGPVLVTGSFYLVGEVTRRVLLRR